MRSSSLAIMRDTLKASARELLQEISGFSAIEKIKAAREDLGDSVSEISSAVSLRLNSKAESIRRIATDLLSWTPSYALEVAPSAEHGYATFAIDADGGGTKATIIASGGTPFVLFQDGDTVTISNAEEAANNIRTSIFAVVGNGLQLTLDDVLTTDNASDATMTITLNERVSLLSPQAVVTSGGVDYASADVQALGTTLVIFASAAGIWSSLHIGDFVVVSSAENAANNGVYIISPEPGTGYTLTLYRPSGDCVTNHADTTIVITRPAGGSK